MHLRYHAGGSYNCASAPLYRGGGVTVPAPVQLDRITLTKLQLRATEIMLYRTADLIDRLLADNHIPYTKMENPTPQQYPPPQGYAGQLAPAPTPLASEIAPP